MTSNVMPSVIQIEEESLKQLVTQVRETIATDVKLSGRQTNLPTAQAVITPAKSENKKFGIVDMWNCQRNIRTAVSMRRH